MIYRDLKPENVLIDREGFAVLTDFGLSKDSIMGEDFLTKSFCGTTEYLAPEVLLAKQYGSSYGNSCDWWSFGCLLYEMLTSNPPFYSSSKEEIYNKIQFAEPRYYNFLDERATDLLKKLLKKNPEERLCTFDQIKKHPFFSDINWERLLKRDVKSPYKPLLQNDEDTNHFD